MAPSSKAGALFRRVFPEQQVFLRSDGGTRYIRLSPLTQVVALGGVAMTVGWTIVASSILVMDTIGSGNLRDQAQREQALYEERLNALSDERDTRATEARLAQQRFATALAEVSKMQSVLLASEDRRRELETGIEVIQSTLRRTMDERDDARESADVLTAQLEADGTAPTEAGRVRDTEIALETVAGALSRTAAERDILAGAAARAETDVEDLLLDARLAAERNDRIFGQLEEAVSVSLEPLDKMFRDTNIVLLVLFALCCRGLALILSAICFFTAKDPKAKSNAIIVMCIDGALIVLAIILNVTGVFANMNAGR